MNIIRFYGHFAAAYGTCWLLLFLVAIITQSSIHMGELGMFGLPVASAIYAYLRFKGSSKLESAITRTGLWIDQQVDRIIKWKRSH